MFFLFRPADPPMLGAGGELGILATSTVAQDCVTSCVPFFRWYNFASPVMAKIVALLRVFEFPSTYSRHAPLAGDMAVVFVHSFPVP